VVRRLLLLGLLPPLLAGCLHATVTSAGPPVVVCGTTLWAGAMTPVVWPLESPGPERPPAPATDRLPAPTRPGVGSGADDYVRVSGCDRGAVVAVDPIGGARLRTVARANDHHLAAIVLEVTEPVTVRAWRGGVYLGARRLDPTVSEPATGPGSASPTR
jgi:hypothetical protein